MAQAMQPVAASREACIQAARDAYGRLLALLVARSRDIATSEDALADAFEAALTTWPRDGVPHNPAAWLFTVARRRTLDHWRHTRVQDEAVQDLLLLTDTLFEDDHDSHAVPDERLRLLFVCAHPAIAAEARAPLMLQTVLGLDVARMANAFLTSPGTLGQRLVRAKARIRAAGIPFDYPEARELPQRLADVLDGIYAAYGTGWDDVEGADAMHRDLTREAISLCRILCTLMPREADPRGLLALMLFCESRAAARRDAMGRYVPLDAQDIQRWDAAQQQEAEACLQQAAALEEIGPYQLEAAIQSAHTQQRLGAQVPAEALVALYDALLALRPSAGVLVGHACAIGRARGATEALHALDAMDNDRVRQYQPWWAARAHWMVQARDLQAARAAYQQAMGLATTPAVRAHLALCAAALAAD